MITFFDNVDSLLDYEFGLWFAVLLLASGAVCGVIMVLRWVVRQVAYCVWLLQKTIIATNCILPPKDRLRWTDILLLGAAMKNAGPYKGPAYWPAMDRLRELWIEREERETNGSPT